MHDPPKVSASDDDALNLERFWQDLLHGSEEGGKAPSPAPHISSIDAEAPTPQPAEGSTHAGAPRVSSGEASPPIDNFEILRRLYQHRELLAGELARETPGPEHTRKTHEPQHEHSAARPRMLGDYQLLEQIGRGGMGVVYKARQMSLGRIVAVKHMRAGKFAYENEIQRFKVEVETAARLQHPNIVAIHEVGVEHGEPYFSMDYIEGPSLSAVVREQLLQPAQAARYVSAIARAVEYAHSRGVIHRDLKPANILLGPGDQPMITDFGLAKQFAAESEEAEPRPALTHTGDIVGTPSYMSPEQATGIQSQIGPASDIYALGAVLYELVTGRPPFRAETSLATLKLVLEAEPVMPR